MLPEKQRQTMTQAIDRVTGEVVEGLLEDMYRNPFWEARYGERGRVHTRQDTRYHLDYLKSAITLNNPPTLVHYYHWCQGLLVYRGMCTLHLQQTLDSLGRQLAQRLPETWLLIEPFHRASYAGLYYDHPACLVLAPRLDEIARQASQRAGCAGSDERRQALSIQDNRYHLTYLADAVNYQYPEAFTRYITWLAAFFPQLNLSVDDLHAALRVLAEEISQALGAEEAGPFVSLIRGTVG